MNKYSVYYEEVGGQPHVDDSARHLVATFERYEDAVDYCKKRLDKEVGHVAPEEASLYYMHHGLDYWITPEPEGAHFSSRDYMNEHYK